jgi:hypothetical protein
LKRPNYLARREVVSDAEDEKYFTTILHRKVDMLNIGCIDEEFQMKTNCLRKKSADF